MQDNIIAQNRKASFEFHLEEHFEAGIVLLGTEVKSLRMKSVSLNEGFILIHQEEAFLHNVHIGEYPYARKFNHAPNRVRKLLLHRRQIKKLAGSVARKGYTLVPTKLYFNAKGRVKLDIALAKGKNKVDQRAKIKEREWSREKARLVKVS